MHILSLEVLENQSLGDSRVLNAWQLLKLLFKVIVQR